MNSIGWDFVTKLSSHNLRFSLKRKTGTKRTSVSFSSKLSSCKQLQSYPKSFFVKIGVLVNFIILRIEVLQIAQLLAKADIPLFLSVSLAREVFFSQNSTHSQGNPLDMSDVVISTDLSEIVESICKDGGFPDSPPDSGSEHLLSPSSMVNPESVGGYTNVGANIGADEYYLANNHLRNNNPRDYTNTNMLPDLSKINYTVPMQMIEEDYKVKFKDFSIDSGTLP